VAGISSRMCIVIGEEVKQMDLNRSRGNRLIPIPNKQKEK